MQLNLSGDKGNCKQDLGGLLLLQAAAAAPGLHDCEADLMEAGTIARRDSAWTPYLHLGVHAREQNQWCVGAVGQSDEAVPSGKKEHAHSSRRAKFQHRWLAAAASDCRLLAGACPRTSVDSFNTIAAAAAIVLQHVLFLPICTY